MDNDDLDPSLGYAVMALVFIAFVLALAFALNGCQSGGGDSTCNPVSSAVEHGVEIITCQNGTTIVSGIPVDSNNLPPTPIPSPTP